MRAWWSVTQKAPKRKRKRRTEEKEQPKISRLQAHRNKHGEDPDFPPLRAGHLVEYLYEVGPVMPGGFAPMAVTHGEIAAFAANTCTPLTPWEASSIRRLSFVHLDEIRRCDEDQDRPCPFQKRPKTKVTRRAVSDLRASMRALAGKA